VTSILTELLATLPVAKQAVELVERKGIGHPDTLCDHLAEAMSQALCRTYLEEAGRVLHYNIENAFLVAGSSTPSFGGGSLDRPLQFVYGDSATMILDGRPLPVEEVAEDAARTWLRQRLPLVDPERHVQFRSELRAGSAQLTDLFERERLGANDTCVGSGFAPLTETEALVLAAEEYLNSAPFKERFPETGQDIKVTGVRRGRELSLILSLAFVDAAIPNEAAYFDRKVAVVDALERFARSRVREIDSVEVAINTLDREGHGPAGVYLTVLGTSADGADGGQVGRGNRPSGVNSFNRPLATGAVAGKNPVSNVGKIYNLLAGHLAGLVHRSIDGLAEVQVSLCSAIGRPIDEPFAVSVRAVPDGAEPAGADGEIRRIVEEQLSTVDAFVDRLVHDPPRVC
jgi:S-adenosylmethionine synthetase